MSIFIKIVGVRKSFKCPLSRPNPSYRFASPKYGGIIQLHSVGVRLLLNKGRYLLSVFLFNCLAWFRGFCFHFRLSLCSCEVDLSQLHFDDAPLSMPSSYFSGMDTNWTLQLWYVLGFFFGMFRLCMKRLNVLWYVSVFFMS